MGFFGFFLGFLGFLGFFLGFLGFLGFLLELLGFFGFGDFGDFGIFRIFLGIFLGIFGIFGIFFGIFGIFFGIFSQVFKIFWTYLPLGVYNVNTRISFETSHVNPLKNMEPTSNGHGDQCSNPSNGLWEGVRTEKCCRHKINTAPSVKQMLTSGASMVPRDSRMPITKGKNNY